MAKGVGIAILCGIGSSSALAGDSDGQFQNYLDEVVESGVPGVVLQVSHKNLHWAGAAGVSNVEAQKTLNLNDTFPVFSVTKTMTAAVTLQLIDEGQLSMEDTLGDLMSGTEHADRVAQIPNAENATVRQLLNHSSGLYDYGNAMAFLMATIGTDADFSKRWSIDDLLAYAEDPQTPPTGTPGSTFSYTSTGYLLLGLVIENIEQKPLAQVMAERLFQPLDMDRSHLADHDEWDPPNVTGYVMTNPEMLGMGLAGGFPTAAEGIANSTKGSRSRLSAGRGESGVIANADSLMSFANALFDGELFTPSLLAEMVAPQDKAAANSAESVHNYGLGVHLFEHGDQVWVTMMGNGAGGEAAVGRELSSGFTFVVLANAFGANVAERTMEMLASMQRGNPPEK